MTATVRESTRWRNLGIWIALVLLSPLILAMMLVALLLKPFARPIEMQPEEVVKYLRDFIDGTGGDWDFDDFTSIPIADPRLESIRERAAQFCGPIDEDGERMLRELLAEASALANESRNT